MTVQEKLKKHLLGQEIDRIEKDEFGNNAILYLKNGKSLTLYESNQDCCAVARGHWKLPEGEIHGGVTDVQFSESESRGDDTYWTECAITILHEDEIFATARGHANAGNGGYYFSSLSLRVRLNDEHIDNFDVISS